VSVSVAMHERRISHHSPSIRERGAPTDDKDPSDKYNTVTLKQGVRSQRGALFRLAPNVS